MERILKDGNGNILKNSNGLILKERPFEQTIVQNGLIFWGRSDINLLTLVNGLISEAYDVRETDFSSPVYGKMVQNTVAYRPEYSSGQIKVLGTTKNITHNITTSIKTLFIVIKGGALGECGISLDSNRELYSTASNQMRYYFAGSSTGKRLYGNTTLFTNGIATTSNNFAIYHTVSDFNDNGKVNVGGIYQTATSAHYILEWGWYNRVLNSSEAIYNINALNAKYSIF